jgi:stalled ribosome rescue protein Dom34
MDNKVIWIDKEKAFVLTVNQEVTDMKTIWFKEIDNQFGQVQRHGGASEIIKDRRVLERDKHKTKLYFDTIASGLSDVKALMITGPAQLGKHFEKYLKNDHPDLGAKVQEVRKSEQMTENQLKALAKDFFTPTT